MARPRKNDWADMDYDHELLLDELITPSRTEECGPIPEFLAKTQAEQACKTYLDHRVSVQRFMRFMGSEATAGDVTESAGYRFLPI